MKVIKRLTVMLLVAIMAVGVVPLTAMANTNPINPDTGNPASWGIANSEPRNRSQLWAAFPNYRGQVFYRGFTPGSPNHFTSYMGVNFTEGAINARIEAMRVLYPHGAPWSVATVSANCGVFATMMQEAAFGWWPQAPSSPVRVHENWNEIRVGDIVHLENSVGGGHAVFVIAVSADGRTFTLAEGSFGNRVNWDRQITLTQLQRTRGHNSGINVLSRFNEDGTIVNRPDAIQDPALVPERPPETETPGTGTTPPVGDVTQPSDPVRDAPVSDTPTIAY